MPLARHVLLHSQETAMAGNTTSFNESISDESMGEKLSGAASQVKNTASDLGRAAIDKIDENRDAAASGMERASSALHENAESLPGGEKMSDFAHTAADKLSSSAQYIRENDSSRMMADVETLVKNNPVSSLVAAGVLGVLVGRAFSSND